MENFDELQNLWNQQAGAEVKPTVSDLIKKAKAGIRQVQRGYAITTGILSSLLGVLLFYFNWVDLQGFNKFNIGLAVMVGVIVIRVSLEVVSVYKLKTISPDLSMVEFSHKMARFYKWRRMIHVFFFPTIYLAYTLGFALLLPQLKENLSNGMFLYVLISGFGSLAVLALFIFRQLKKEAKMLTLLKSIE
jgi:hypothetical protein